MAMVKTKVKNFSTVQKRDGRSVPFNQERITNAILKAIKAVRGAVRGNKNLAQRLSDQVVKILKKEFKDKIINIEQIQDIVEKVLVKESLFDIAKAYILYRDQRAKIRNLQSLIDSDKLMEDYLKQLDWRVKENSNMDYSLQGLNNYVSSAVSSHYWLNKIYSPKIRQAHLSGDFHLHDLQLLSAYCCGWDLRDILIKGFKGVTGKVESKPPKHFRAALGQVVNFFYTLQGETAGAQALSNFDTYLAPFIRYDQLSYKEIKQAIQEFMFNMNVPTRVGFQCLSEDTDILTAEGWKKHSEIREGMLIKTFNLKRGVVENKKIKSVFRKKYKGIMYNLKNRIQDQMISPGHRVVRKKFQTDRYVLEPIEDVLKLKSPFIAPIAAQNSKPDVALSDERIKLMAWVIGEGSIEKEGKRRCCYRVSIYQSSLKNKKNYEEIKKLLEHFKLTHSEYTQQGLGEPVQRIRLNAESSKKIHEWFGKEKVKFIPKILLDMSERQSKLFIDTYLKAEGFENCKIATADMDILNDLQAIASNAGYGSTVLERRPTIGNQMIYILRLIKHQDTYINKIEKINYSGIIWCPNTENGTVVARRNGKVFITGNTPFTNITLDLVCPKTIGEETVIIGGELREERYHDFQREMDLFNLALVEVMLEGDAQKRVFTFPIPTYNISKDFNWNSPVADKIFEITARYGIPYFSNFINSEMSPEDARSMCCRLRLDNRELRKRGGLFAANPLTGSIGVVTINMPRLGYLAKNKKDFFNRLAGLMDLSKESLETKRKILERLTAAGLYPYSKYYLADIQKRFNLYWKNHFSTIGLNGMNECCLNFLNKNIAAREGHKFAREVLDFMRQRMMDYQNETGNLFNLEATPAEGTSYRFAKIDKEQYPDIIVANESNYQKDGAAPYYTNSTHLPVDYTDDVFDALELQDDLQTKYTGGTVFHAFIGEKITSAETVKQLVKKIAENFRLPYFTISPTFSICPIHGYLAGEHFYCPKCEEGVSPDNELNQQLFKKQTACEVYSRIVGYIRPAHQWNKGKQEEFKDRKTYKVIKSLSH